MIFGKTYEQRYAAARAKVKELMKPVEVESKYTIFPTLLENGQYIWLQKAYYFKLYSSGLSVRLDKNYYADEAEAKRDLERQKGYLFGYGEDGLLND